MCQWCGLDVLWRLRWYLFEVQVSRFLSQFFLGSFTGVCCVRGCFLHFAALACRLSSISFAWGSFDLSASASIRPILSFIWLVGLHSCAWLSKIFGWWARECLLVTLLGCWHGALLTTGPVSSLLRSAALVFGAGDVAGASSFPWRAPPPFLLLVCFMFLFSFFLFFLAFYFHSRCGPGPHVGLPFVAPPWPCPFPACGWVAGRVWSHCTLFPLIKPRWGLYSRTLLRERPSSMG